MSCPKGFGKTGTPHSIFDDFIRKVLSGSDLMDGSTSLSSRGRPEALGLRSVLTRSMGRHEAVGPVLGCRLSIVMMGRSSLVSRRLNRSVLLRLLASSVWVCSTGGLALGHVLPVSRLLIDQENTDINKLNNEAP